jgi:hypothetical protein
VPKPRLRSYTTFIIGAVHETTRTPNIPECRSRQTLIIRKSAVLSIRLSDNSIRVAGCSCDGSGPIARSCRHEQGLDPHTPSLPVRHVHRPAHRFTLQYSLTVHCVQSDPTRAAIYLQLARFDVCFVLLQTRWRLRRIHLGAGNARAPLNPNR